MDHPSGSGFPRRWEFGLCQAPEVLASPGSEAVRALGLESPGPGPPLQGGPTCVCGLVDGGCFRVNPDRPPFGTHTSLCVRCGARPEGRSDVEGADPLVPEPPIQGGPNCVQHGLEEVACVPVSHHPFSG